MTTRLTIIIEPDGQTNIDMAGFKGKACDSERDMILKDLDQLGIPSDTKDIKHKSEYYQKETEKSHVYR